MFNAAAINSATITTIRRSFGVALMMLILVCAICAQTTTTSSTDGSTPLGIAPGAPAGSYALSDIEVVNLFNGNVNLRLPLIQLNGRGGSGTTLMLAFNQQQWRVMHQRIVNLQTGDETHSYVPTTNSWGGLQPGYGLGVLQGRRAGKGAISCTGRVAKHYSQSLTRLTFTMQDGTEYELIDQLTGGKPATFANVCDPGGSRGTVFITADGTSATFISDTTIFDAAYKDDFRNFTPSGYLMLRDGSRYRIDGGRVSWMRDRNGNKLTATYDTYSSPTVITDSLNRKVTFSYTYGVEDVITYTGFGGGQRTIRISQTNLSNVLIPSEMPARTYNQLFPSLNGSGASTYNPKVTSAVVLPDGRSYSFFYNRYGQLAKIVLPTGGIIEYDYPSSPGVFSYFVDGDEYGISRPVVERRVLVNNTVVSKTRYSGTGTVTVDHLNPSASDALISREKHYFYGSSNASLYLGPVEYSSWKNGKEYQTEQLNTDGLTLLKRVANTFQQRAAVSWWTGLPDSAPPNDPRLTETVTTLADTTPNKVTKQTFDYNQYTSRTDVWEYDFGSGAVPTYPLRHTRTSYMSNNSVNGSNYATDTNIHLRNLPKQTQVYSVNPSTGAETLAAQTDYEYDRYDASAGHAALQNRTSISGLDSGFTTGYQTRGNVTAVSRWLNTTGGSITTYQQYDIAGNVVKSIDGRGYATTYDYTDRFGSPDGNARSNSAPFELGGLSSYAFASAATNALGHTAYTQVDYYTGKPVDAEDANGIVASGYYNDLLDRPTQFVLAVGTSIQNRTLFSYDDFNRIVTTQKDLNTYTDGLLQSQVLYDQLGRGIETRSYEPGGGYVKATTSFDAMGRASRVTNPHRSTSDDTYGWTDTTYDALGRTIRVESFDRFGASTGAIVTSPSNNLTTVRDQANKQRRSTTDGSGRLTKVEELYDYPSSSVYATTTYSYNALDNLTNVAQGSQSRSFVYDSLARLTSATNPESGTVTYGYDANSNLSSKQDARFITTTYLYDQLNRVTSRTYSDTTPGVTFSYDSVSVLYSKGRPTSVSSSVSATNYDEYDQMGRLKRSKQTTDGQAYQFSYGYDLAGNLTSQTYPSGRTVSTSFDVAGRVSQVSGTKAGEAAKTYASSFGYSPHGAVSSMKLGNNLWEHTLFNSRLQPREIGLGTSSTDSSKLRLDYGYGTTNNNGNLLSQTINLPGLTLSQTYSYDQVNRLLTAQESVSGVTRWTQTYSFDQYGNRSSLSNTGSEGFLLPTQSTPAVVASTNRLSGYGYDSAGNMTSDQVGSTFGYDAENHQTSSNVSGVSVTYSYDGDGRRVKKVAGSGTTVFVYNASGQMIAEYTSTTPQSNGTSYLTSDHLGSTRVVTDASGVVKGRHDYLPYGEEVGAGIGSRTTGLGYGQADGIRQKFTSKERDAESGLDYFGARYYSSAQGRFTSADAFWKDSYVGDPQSWNKYAYARNSPLKYVDPTGEKATVTIETDEKLKKGKITIKASIAIWTTDKNLSKRDLNIAAADIKQSIESAWKGTYEQDGIKFEVSADIDVTVQGSESDATKSGAQNVIEIFDDKPGEDSTTDGHSIFGGADTGRWGINGISGGLAAHEFTHLLGVDNHNDGPYLSNTRYISGTRATPYDYGWAFGGAIKSHRAASRQYRGDGNSLETRTSRPFSLGPYESYRSTRELRAAIIWWR